MVVAGRSWWVALVLAASACAARLAPEHEARNRQLERIARECQAQHPGVVSVEIKPDGFLDAKYKDSLAESGRPFLECYGPKARPLLFPTGRLAAEPGLPATDSVPVRVQGTTAFVSVRVNGQPMTLLLDTGASRTILHPEPAARAGLVPSRGSVRARIQVFGGRTLHVPLVRAKTVALGAYTLEDMDVGVYEAVPGAQGVDGVLGTDVLGFFRLRLDPDLGRLTMEVTPGQAAARATTPPDGPAPAPPRLVQPTFWLDRGQTGLLPESGRVVSPPGGPTRTVLRVEETVGNSVLVPLRVNGAELTLLLAYGLKKTWVTAEAAARAGLEPPAGGLRVQLVDPQGNRRPMALVVAQRIEAGDLTVEGFHVGVVDAGEYAVYDGDGRRLRTIDGQVGIDFLRLFHWDYSRAARTLALQPLD